MATTDTEVAIVGGGIAGLSAALLLSRSRRNVTVIDAQQPRNRRAEHLHGYLGHDGNSPDYLLSTGRSEATRYGATIRTGTVEQLRLSADSSSLLTLGEHMIRAKAVIVATGLSDALPAVQGLAEGWGRWAFHCPYCHGYELQGAPVAVLGGANRMFSLKQAGLLTQWSPRVSLYLNGMKLDEQEHARLSSLGVEIIDASVKAVSKNYEDGVTLILDGGEKTLVDNLFVGPEFSPNDQLLRNAGCRREQTGFVAVDGSGRTHVPGLWAAGNVVSSPAQLINSAAAGATAAISANDALVFG